MRLKGVVRSVCVLTAALALAACGGGGSGGGGVSSTATLKGVVEFPDAGAGKAVSKVVTADNIVIEVFNLKGDKIKEVKPEFDDAAPALIYSYEVPGLAPGVDYVLKAKKTVGGKEQVVKKLIEKEDVVAGVIEGQSVNPASTAAVIVAEQKVEAALGKDIEFGATLPSGVTVDHMSTELNKVKPAVLELEIKTLATAAEKGDLSSIESPADASLVNIYRMVHEAVSQGVDAEDVAEGNVSVTINITIIVVADNGSVTTEAKELTAEEIASDVSDAAEGYTPPTDTKSAGYYVDIARKYLNVQDIANASINFEKALAIDPDNKDANFAGAIARGIMLIENENVKDIIERWGEVSPTVNEVVTSVSPIGNPFDNMTSIRNTGSTILAKTTAKAAPVQQNTVKLTLDAFNSLKGKLPQQKAGSKSVAKALSLVPTTAPSVTEMQAVLDGEIVPEIKVILARLAKVEGQGYTFTVTKGMQGNPYGMDETLDDGEFYTLDAFLNGVASLAKIATAYNLDVKDNDYNALAIDPLKTLNAPTFFTLKSDGKAKMAEALTFLKAARDKAESAYGVVSQRTAGQGLFDITGWSTTSKDEFVKLLGDIKPVLAGKATITIDGKSVVVDATKFFTNPLDRSDLPQLGYDVEPDPTLSAQYGEPVAGEWSDGYGIYPIYSDIVPKSDLPDYTLNGILPENSAANNVAGFNGILPVLDGKLLKGEVDGYLWNVMTDGSAFYYVHYSSGHVYDQQKQMYTVTRDIKRIDPATGTVAKYVAISYSYGVGQSRWLERLVYVNGDFYALMYTSIYDPATYQSTETTAFYPIVKDGSTWSVGTTPVATIPSESSNGSIGGVAVNGTDIYYTINSWNDQTWASSAEVHKLSGFGTTNSDSLLFTEENEYIESIGLSNGYLYTSDGPTKRNLDGTVVATYDNAWFTAMLGGYFYEIYDNKLIKYAGTPQGTAAKLLAKFF